MTGRDKALQQDNGPSGSGNYAMTRFNALQHGILSQYTVLPWEDEGQYEALLKSLVAEHAPEGPTEEHLVEELVGVLWRKRRLRFAEAASYRRGLRDAAQCYNNTDETALLLCKAAPKEASIRDALRMSEGDIEEARKDMAADAAMTEKALDVLGVGGANAYAQALAELREDTRSWWEQEAGRRPDEYESWETPWQATAADLRRFLETKVADWYRERRKELDAQPLLRRQALAESFEPNRLERLARYEVHLDRKLEKMLAMLIRLQDIRTGNSSD